MNLGDILNLIAIGVIVVIVAGAMVWKLWRRAEKLLHKLKK